MVSLVADSRPSNSLASFLETTNVFRSLLSEASVSSFCAVDLLILLAIAESLTIGPTQTGHSSICLNSVKDLSEIYSEEDSHLKACAISIVGKASLILFKI